MLIDTRKSPYAQVWSLPRAAFTWRDGFWKERTARVADTMVPHVLGLFESDDDFHAVANFQIAANLRDGHYKGPPFDDGDFYKILEGAMLVAYERQDAALEARIDRFIQLIGQAQQPDGYLSTKQIIGEREHSGIRRQGDINDFEAYNFGHLFTAACTHHRLTGKRTLLEIAIRAAGYLESLYQEAERTGKVQTAVCPSHYMGLVELYRETGQKRFLETAGLAIRLRDLVPNGSDDNQDRIPLLEHDKILGHAVRATYLYAGAADLYLETGDARLLAMLDKVWHDLADKKLYLTGGCGALYSGVSPFGDFLEGYLKKQVTHQAFGYAYQLPNITAYNETCATLGHIFWMHRMFAAKPRARLFDLIERSFFNLALAAVSLDGGKYFYENPLRRTPKFAEKVMWPLERSSKLSCFCCPTNLARSLLEVIEYTGLASADEVWLGVYGAHEARYTLEGGMAFTLVQDTDYPWDGTIRLSCKDIENPRPFTLQVRIPGWLESGSVSLNGQRTELGASDADTYLPMRLEDPARDLVTVVFDMPSRTTMAHPLVEEAAGQVAVERGPLVYCLESPDVPADTLDAVHVYADAAYTPVPFELDGQKLVALEGEGAVMETPGRDPNRLYQPLRTPAMRAIPIRLIPYFAWDNRGSGEMRIWLPVIVRQIKKPEHEHEHEQY